MFEFAESWHARSPIIVAELGASHQGDLRRGLELVDAAADSGAHVAKLQVIFADEILPPEVGLVQLPGGRIPLFEVFKSLERPADFYAALKERALSRGLEFLASPFGKKGFELLEEIGVRAWKIASPELNHEELVENLARTGKPLILSTGVSEIEDIRRALKVVEGAFPGETRQSIALLHCLSSYPAPENQANLRTIQTLKKTFGIPVGISDHSRHAVLIPALASALGAAIIEKHITLSHHTGGLDDLMALDAKDFAEMCEAVFRYAPPWESEAPEEHLAKAIEELASEYGRERVEAALGNGIKRLARAETANYGRSNRSLHAIGFLPAGIPVSEENSAILRTEHNLRPGIRPQDRRRAYGRRLVNSIPPGEGIRWEDLE